jgi:3-phenylpropionate/trans-cinnamate dioxygenase ferredoxin reductase subunit
MGPLGGVPADARLQTSAPGVFAAGDMCEYESVIHGRRMRIEHEEVAAAQGATAALNMLGGDVVHEVVPYFFSDLSDWASVEYVGPALTWDEEILRGSYDDHSFTLWYLERDRLVAALTVGRSQELDVARRLIASGADVSALRDRLSDSGANLDELARA